MKRWVKLTLFGLLMAAGLYYGAWLYWQRIAAQYVADSCDTIANVVVVQSPDGGKKVAAMDHQVCAGGFGSGFERYWITLHDRENIDGDDKIIFGVYSQRPEMKWVDARTLLISIKRISDIYLSLHEQHSVKIKYAISSSLSRVNYERSIEEYQTEIKSQIANGFAVFSRNKTTDYKTLQEIVSRRYEHYNQFAAWAKANDASENSETSP